MKICLFYPDWDDLFNPKFIIVRQEGEFPGLAVKIDFRNNVVQCNVTYKL